MSADSFGQCGKEPVPDADGMTRFARIMLLLDNNCLTPVIPVYLLGLSPFRSLWNYRLTIHQDRGTSVDEHKSAKCA